MNVLSLFDGKSSGYTALELAGFAVDNYYSSEIDKYAIQVSNAIHPNQVRLGNVLDWHFWDVDWSSIDLVLGGFPCQAWSMAGKQQGDKDERGMLFWYMLDIMQYVLHHNPSAKFLIENVKMKKEFEEYITFHTEQALGAVNKRLINSALVSAQNRNRYYWTNIDGVTQPEDSGVLLNDIIEPLVDDVNSDGWHKWFDKNKEFQLRKGYSKVIDSNSKDKAICMTARQFASWNGNFVVRATVQKNAEHTYNGKCPTITSAAGMGGGNVPLFTTPEVASEHKGRYIDKDERLKYRKLTPRECFRLQTVPEHLIDKILSCGVSNSQLYKIAGNGWTDEVIAHIFSFMK